MKLVRQERDRLATANLFVEGFDATALGLREVKGLIRGLAVFLSVLFHIRRALSTADQGVS